jgi:peptide/nickel transport system permease protein
MDPSASLAGPTAPSAGIPAAETAASRAQRTNAGRERLRLLVKRPAFIIGVAVMLFWIACAILGQRITPYDPFNGFDLGRQPPSAHHLFGTDRIGRDVLSRVMVGSRDVLIVAPPAARVRLGYGTLHRLLNGY